MSTRRIAQLAGISPTAVSFALRNSPKVSERTRQKVLRIAKRLGYHPNAKVAELMSHLRLNRTSAREACLAVVSFYENPKPWEQELNHRLIYKGMTERATALGYRLEPLWLRAPGMTYKRIRDILDARGIQGLLCFGSPNLNEDFPRELDHYAIVTQGVSIRTPLHRVISHVHNAMWRVLQKVHELGYRRPGLVIGEYEGERNSHMYLSVYLGWCHLNLGQPPAPVMQLKHLEEEPMIEWLRRHRPDVLIFAHHYNALAAFRDMLRRHRIRVPAEMGVVAISQLLDGTPFSGMQANPELAGSWVVELLVSRIMNRDFGIPTQPRVLMVDMQWIDGHTLRRRPS